MWADQITREYIDQLHAEAIQRYGGDSGPPRPGCIEGSVGAAHQTAFYETGKDEPDILNVAVNLLFYLASNHCYIDGNKRVAWMAFIDALGFAEVSVNATQEEAQTVVEEVVTHRLDRAGLLMWAAERMMARPSAPPPPAASLAVPDYGKRIRNLIIDDDDIESS